MTVGISRNALYRRNLTMMMMMMMMMMCS